MLVKWILPFSWCVYLVWAFQQRLLFERVGVEEFELIRHQRPNLVEVDWVERPQWVGCDFLLERCALCLFLCDTLTTERINHWSATKYGFTCSGWKVTLWVQG